MHALLIDSFFLIFGNLLHTRVATGADDVERQTAGIDETVDIHTEIVLSQWVFAGVVLANGLSSEHHCDDRDHQTENAIYEHSYQLPNKVDGFIDGRLRWFGDAAGGDRYINIAHTEEDVQNHQHFVEDITELRLWIEEEEKNWRRVDQPVEKDAHWQAADVSHAFGSVDIFQVGLDREQCDQVKDSLYCEEHAGDNDQTGRARQEDEIGDEFTDFNEQAEDSFQLRPQQHRSNQRCTADTEENEEEALLSEFFLWRFFGDEIDAELLAEIEDIDEDEHDAGNSVFLHGVEFAASTERANEFVFVVDVVLRSCKQMNVTMQTRISLAVLLASRTMLMKEVVHF